MKIAEQLNDTLRRLWEDCKVKKLNEISGRWLYMEEDFKPSKAQLQIIFKWAHDKADDFRVYLGDEFVNLDVLQCKINSAE